MADVLAAMILVLLFFACCTNEGLKFKVNGQVRILKIENADENRK